MQHPLKARFYESFDASSVLSFVERINRLSEPERHNLPQCIGEGIHFQCFALDTQPLPLVANVAKRSFLDRGPGAVERWQKAIQDLRHVDDAELVPPMEVIRTHDILVLVMPRGKPIKGPGSGRTKTLETKLIATARALGKAGLILDDYPQILEQGGTPFINDWSDLSRLNAGPSRSVVD